MDFTLPFHYTNDRKYILIAAKSRWLHIYSNKTRHVETVWGDRRDWLASNCWSTGDCSLCCHTSLHAYASDRSVRRPATTDTA